MVLSGHVSGAGHDVTVLDAIVEKLSAKAAEQRVMAIQPDVFIALSGAIAWG